MIEFSEKVFGAIPFSSMDVLFEHTNAKQAQNNTYQII
jgi:hypothetical protein